MAKMTERICRCGKKYMARTVDIRRGWGMSCSKRCAAKKRTRRECHGDFRIAEASARYPGRGYGRRDDYGFDAEHAAYMTSCGQDD